jgi:hypothetical protein
MGHEPHPGEQGPDRGPGADGITRTAGITPAAQINPDAMLPDAVPAE